MAHHSYETLSRRALLGRWSIGSAALVRLLLRDGLLCADGGDGALQRRWPHFAPRAKRVIHVFACGGCSHVDSFDYKPELLKHHGKELGGDERPDVFFGQVGLLHRPFWEFKQRGQSGLWISELFPHLAAVSDELTVIHSMFAETSNHTPATFQANSGFRLNGFPVLGAWLSYGLGSESDELPTYVVLPDTRGLPAGGSINWTAAFLPGRHQGVMFRSKGPAIADLFPAKEIAASTEHATRELLGRMNRRHLAARGESDLLASRIHSYELAARMQRAVPEVTDLGRETQETHKLYGLDRPETADVGRNCLLARRLVERGVRLVQLFAGGAFGQPRINWDGHEDMTKNHGREAGRIDQPLAGLIRDLRRRGMLDNTLVMFTTEFGRTPFTQSADGVLGKGRDHNQYGYTVWLAGAGLRAGFAYGATDPLGLKAVADPMSIYDFHATVLHLLGIDHERLTFYHNGIRRRLTNVHGKVVHALLA